MKSIPNIALANKAIMAFLLLVAASSSFILQAHSAGETGKSDPSVKTPSERIWFEENKNQWPEQVLYQANMKGGQVFLEKGTFTYFLTDWGDMEGFKHGRIETVVVRNHAYKIHFTNSNPYTRASASSPASFVRNYYRGHDPAKWASGVKAYQQVSYSELYSKIDLNVYSSENGLKYDFVLQPGAALGDIKLTYEGTDELTIHNGNLNIQTSLGMVIEQKPYSYQIIGGEKVEVSCAYILRENTLGFFAGSFDTLLPLIIDPQLIFSTYTGSPGDNWGFTATYDEQGNAYTGGIIGAAGYPVTMGAFQNTFQGGGTGGNWVPYDISLSKFNPGGTALLFSTYYGGSDNEQPMSLIVNGIGELVVFGRTYSTDFPVTAGVYQSANAGGADIIVGKFNSTGGLIASTYIGGTDDDAVNTVSTYTLYGPLKFNYSDDGRGEVMIDNANNIYIATSTRSANFPTTAGVVDNTLDGIQDACVFKFNSALTSLMWSTYLGGSKEEAGYGIKIDGSGNPCVTGGTNSINFPTTAGVLKPGAPGGTADGFVTVLNSSATGILRSTYIGTNAYDQSFFIELDNQGDIYVMGQTRGAYPNTPGIYSNPNSGQFIHKMNNALTATVFSMTFGSGTTIPNISPTAFLVDSCQNIYASGWGRCAGFTAMPTPGATTGMPTTAGAFQTATDGCDFYFFVLTANAKSLWYATFFGQNGGTGDHVDGGTSRFDRKGIIYQSVCASCGGGQTFPTSPGAWSNTNGSFNCNNALIKFDVNVKPVAKSSASPSTTGCVPLLVNFSSSGSAGIGFSWDFGDGNTSTLPNPSHTYTAAGTYTVSLIVLDSLSYCAFYDTSYLVIQTSLFPLLNTSQTNLLCFGNNNGSASVGVSNGLSPYTYLWIPVGQTTATATGLTAGTYTLSVTESGGCITTQTITITQPSALTASVLVTSGNCVNTNVSAAANASGGTGMFAYLWNPGGQTTATATGLMTGIYTVTITDANGCTDTATQPIVIYNNPIALFNDKDSGCTPICHSFTDMSSAVSGNIVSWVWVFPGGIPNTSTQQNPINTCYTTPGTYGATLIVTTNYGCTDTFTLNTAINAYSWPKADFCMVPEKASAADPVFTFCDMWLPNPGVTQWYWDFGDGSPLDSVNTDPVHSYSATAVFNDFYFFNVCLYVKNQYGCWDTTCKTAEIFPEFTFYIPNSFTPNSDNKNEFFFGKGRGIKEYDIWLFDRWGNLIWDCHYAGSNVAWDNAGQGGLPAACKWDGMVQAGGTDMSGKSNRIVQEDVYVWKVKLLDILDKKHTYIGHVSVRK